MDVWGAIKVLAYRYYVAIPLCAITMLGAYMFASSTHPEYNATAQMVLLGPTSPMDSKTAPPPPNPYLGLGTATTAAVIQLHMDDVASQQQLLAAGNSNQYTITAASRSPILTIGTVAKTPQVAVSTAAQLVKMIQTDLANIQNPYTTDKGYQITALVAAGSTIATEDNSSHTKTLAIAVGVGLVVTALLTLLLDAILVSRKRKNANNDWTSESITHDAESTQRTPVVRS